MTWHTEIYDREQRLIKERNQVITALEEAKAVLRLIASPRRPDGTYNRDRQACEDLARETLEKLGKA